MKKILALLVALTIFPAQAQQTTGQLTQSIQSILAANNANAINALALQTVLLDMNFSYCNVYLCQLQGPLQLYPSSAAAASVNMGAGVSPTLPNPGDVWMTSLGLNYKIGSTVALIPILATGTCTMSAGTCSAQPFAPVSYSTQPACVCSWTGVGVLNGNVKCVRTQTTVTPASTNAGDSAIIGWACFGN
jgi:hypothetical protein